MHFSFNYKGEGGRGGGDIFLTLVTPFTGPPWCQKKYLGGY